MKKFTYLIAVVFISFVPLNVYAISFTADAVQIRDGEFSHAKLYWTDERVRFDYMDKGVAMAQIFDNVKKKITWLDTENKLFLERELSPHDVMQKVAKKSKGVKNPCQNFKKAQCTRLKEVTVNERESVKWLITVDVHGNDQHVFQWIDKKYGTVVKQENPDGSKLNVTIKENLEVNERKARKVDMYALTQNGVSMHGSQWYDNKLGVVIKQVFADGSMDELRNIKIEKLKKSLFQVPKEYKEVDQSVNNKQSVKTESIVKQSK